jgi:hypothetical protein
MNALREFNRELWVKPRIQFVALNGSARLGVGSIGLSLWPLEKDKITRRYEHAWSSLEA